VINTILLSGGDKDHESAECACITRCRLPPVHAGRVNQGHSQRSSDRLGDQNNPKVAHTKRTCHAAPRARYLIRSWNPREARIIAARIKTYNGIDTRCRCPGPAGHRRTAQLPPDRTVKRLNVSLFCPASNTKLERESHNDAGSSTVNSGHADQEQRENVAKYQLTEL